MQAEYLIMSFQLKDLYIYPDYLRQNRQKNKMGCLNIYIYIYIYIYMFLFYFIFAHVSTGNGVTTQAEFDMLSLEVITSLAKYRRFRRS